MKITIWKRLLRGPAASPPAASPPGREDVYTYRFKLHGKVHTRRTTFANADDARRKAQAHIRSLEAGVHDQVAALFTARAARSRRTVAELLQAQTTIAPGLMLPESARGARLQLQNILRHAGHEAPERVLLSDLDASITRRYADSVLRAALAEQASERRRQQMQRTANSTHATACVLFTRQMRDRYPDHGITLPPSIETFCERPPFPGAASQLEYNIPADAIIAATFADLEQVQRTANPNLYRAVWLALGFGLRKGEIYGARIRDIQTRAGRVVFAVSETCVARRKRDITKNGTVPVIQVANDAWQHLEPMIAGRPGDDYIMTGPNRSARTEYVADAVSAWMRDLGWRTQKALHAWRAYAIAQVVLQTKNLKTASMWARHSSVVTTEKCYGHFLRLDIESVPLVLPTARPEFQPTVMVSPPVSEPAPAVQPAGA